MADNDAELHEQLRHAELHAMEDQATIDDLTRNMHHLTDLLADREEQMRLQTKNVAAQVRIAEAMEKIAVILAVK